ncbi:MAG: LTA synthase family protein [Fidelibacterota bacterium]
MFYYSRRFRFLLCTAAVLFLSFTALRLGFMVIFRAEMASLSRDELWKALFIGLRFDLRLALVIMLPVATLSLVPFFNLVKISSLQRLVKFYLKLVIAGVLLFYALDFGYYGYLDRRLEVSVLRFLVSPLIAGQMIWESYPVVRGLIGLGLVLFAGYKLVNRLVSILEGPPEITAKKQFALGLLVGGLFFLFGIWGTFRQYPLRWSDAFFSDNNFVSALALNPVLYFYDTEQFAEADFDSVKTREYYPLMADYLGVDNPDSQKLDFTRKVPAYVNYSRPPNIVIIFMESVGLNRMGLMGNPLNPTPNLDQLAQEGIFFKRFYVPMVGTARSIFALITGIPDVARVKTSSRNPMIADQYTILKTFKNYRKYFLIGGSASWANIRGLLKHNIPDMEIIEQEDFDRPRLDVWGISDHDLFREAHTRFEALDPLQPFFAIIQTATNHKPYSIPENLENFSVLNPGSDSVKVAGFKTVGQYNAVRLLDNAVGTYFSAASQAEYFKNTIFFLFGDHGTSDPWAQHMPRADFDLKLRSYNVPFIIYGPTWVKSGVVREDITWLCDLLPTAAGLAGIAYRNQTLGRDLLHLPEGFRRWALLVNRKHAYPRVGAIGNNFYLTMYHDGSDLRLHDLSSDTPLTDIQKDRPAETKIYEQMARGLYETAKYMLYHNKDH